MRALPLAALACAALLLPLAADAAPLAYIQPGERVTSSGGQCTLNFVFDGVGDEAGAVYVGTAAHCVPGVNTTMSIAGASPFGHVVWRGNPGWLVTSEPDVPVDFALILVDEAYEGIVRADVKGHPGMPNGSSTFDATLPGEPLVTSGYGLGWSAHAATRENRPGVLLGDDARSYQAYDLTIFGDSGGPVLLLRTGQALGTVSGIAGAVCTGCSPTANGVYDYGPTVEGILSDLAAAGHDVVLRSAS